MATIGVNDIEVFFMHGKVQQKLGWIKIFIFAMEMFNKVTFRMQ